MKPELLIDARAELGEGPAWHAHTQTLFWLDIYGRAVHVFRDGQDRNIPLDEMPGCAAPRRDGGLIVATPGRIASLDLETGALHLLSALPDEPAINRANDGKCDPRGRFLAGTMDNNEEQASGSLYSYDGSATRRLLTGVRISNGLAWSPDHKLLYYIDTPTREVTAFDYDLSTGEIANRRVVFEVPAALGWPDGMTSDTDGNLWIAMWGGAQVTRWDPGAGRLLDQITIPALNTSSCVFGGPDMNELYITSARKGMTEAELQRYPHSGGVFRVVTRASGAPTFAFAG